MSKAHGLVELDGRYYKASVTCKLKSGSGRLLFSGAMPQEMLSPTKAAIDACIHLDFLEGFDPDILGRSDLVIGIDSPAPVVGESLQLTLAVAVVAELLRRGVPAKFCYTGIVGPAGEVIPVDDIVAKRRAAKVLGFSAFVLPVSQLDYFSPEINQCPVTTIEEAISVTFFGDEHG
ncbi:MAG: hypothetical protein E6R03_03075 [Hyphomicrobiaceae bacterium]|nr:MAG: hypothetical protein E6R03_03075 [Hyphomicrobiaceae bacterium]